jgi:hypothetical protein
MGHDWLDVILHIRNTCILIPSTAVLVLEDGRLFVGSDPHRYGRGW